MNISAKNTLTLLQAAQFFDAAESPLQRQYEALRLFFVEGDSAAEVAERFGYTPGSFRVLCHRFRHDLDFRNGFFQVTRPGPNHAPLRDQTRDLVVALRKQYLSVYDIERELAQSGHTLSAHSITVILVAEQAEEILRFVDFWEKHTGQPPDELVFDSKLTTYAQIERLNQRNIHFITLRRRTHKMLGDVWSRPASAWRRINLPALTRQYRSPKVLDERVHVKGYQGELRQVTVIELGHEEPTILLTNNKKIGLPGLVTRYAQRMLIENGISEAVRFFHIDALSSMVGLKVDFDLQITLMAGTLYRLFAERIGAGYGHAQAKKLFRNLLEVSAMVVIESDRVVVTLDKRAHNPFLVKSRLSEEPTPMPWFGGKPLVLRFA